MQWIIGPEQLDVDVAKLVTRQNTASYGQSQGMHLCIFVPMWRCLCEHLLLHVCVLIYTVGKPVHTAPDTLCHVVSCRLYAGIHFPHDVIDGRIVGNQVRLARDHVVFLLLLMLPCCYYCTTISRCAPSLLLLQL